MYKLVILFGLLLGLLPGVAEASGPCANTPPIARTPTTGSPFGNTPGVTLMETQTSDNVRVTGGCIDATIGGQLYAAASYKGAVSKAHCKWTSAEDVGDCINAAIAAASANGGGTVLLPAGSFGLTTTINLASKVKLVGAGAGQFGTCGTLLTWSGVNGGTMVQIGTSTTGPLPIVDPGMANICLNGGPSTAGGSYAAKAVDQWSTIFGDFSHINIGNISGDAWAINVVSTDHIAAKSASNVGNRYSFVSINLCSASGAPINANGFHIGPGTGADDANQNVWMGGTITHGHGIGFIWGGSDANWMYGGAIYPCNSSDASTGYGMYFSGQLVAGTEHSRGNTLFGTSVGGGTRGGIYSEAGGVGLNSAQDNLLFGRKTEDGQPTPACQAQGAASDATSFRWITVAGTLSACGGNPWNISQANIIWKLVAKTADYTLTANDSGFLFNNNGSSGQVTFTLPAAVGSGNFFCFERFTGNAVVVQTDGTDVIRLSADVATAAGGYIKTTTNASRACIVDESASSGHWRALTLTGAWFTEANLALQAGFNVNSTTNALKDVANDNIKVTTAGKDYTSDTTLANIPGLSITLTAGKTYRCRGHLRVSASGAAGGIKVALASDGTLTGTFSSWMAANWNNATINARSSTTGLAPTAIGGATAVSTDVEIEGAIVVAVGGVLSVQAAQNASSGTTTTVGSNSTFECIRTD